ncbi:ABC transporter permease [Arthrobacter sp. H14-L1]|uniref:ABC transporter permease n=1 Tax=Arthrobacter sp. H14-L1 TaxID=2996697 RepID=UPI0022712196|nr:ABC transporter permease [Arthrobacter sp. H14-L1]MCY0905034.1 ABC transporter permease [Arthrobacter sp. H14-L1]
MIGFVVKRFVNYFILTAIATLLAYVLASLSLNPAQRYLGRNPQPSPEVVTSILNGLGVNPDIPVLERLWIWLSNLVTHGSLGITVDNQQVTDVIFARAGVSLRLLIIGSIIGAVLGVVFGVWGAVKQYRVSDQLVSYASFTVGATPTFVIGVVLMILATGLNGLTGHQLINFSGEYTAGLQGNFLVLFGDRINHLILPTITLSLTAAAGYSRYQRSAMLDVLSADYIRTARSKGMSRNSALVKHGVRIALIPMSTYFAYSFALLLTGATVVELVFSWHGMGEYLVHSVQQNDINGVAGSVMFASILVLIAGTLSEVVYAALDPRVRV